MSSVHIYALQRKFKFLYPIHAYFELDIIISKMLVSKNINTTSTWIKITLNGLIIAFFYNVPVQIDV